MCWDQAEKKLTQDYSAEEIQNYLKWNINSFFKEVDPSQVVFFTFTNLDDYLRPLRDWITSHTGAQFLATVPALSQANGLLPDWHPNIKGQSIIAQSIFEQLKKDPRLECK